METLRDQRGIALVTAVLLSLISLIIVLTAIYFIAQATRISGIQKRYQTALEASHGGVDIIAKNVLPSTIQNALTGGTEGFTIGKFKDDHLLLFPSSAPGPYVSSDACFTQKMTLTSNNWTQCTTTDLLNPKASWDMKLTLKGTAPQPDYDVYVKVVDTLLGNSVPGPGAGGTGLIGQGVVESGVMTPQHMPYVYRIEIQGERQQNPDERAQLSVLYAF